MHEARDLVPSAEPTTSHTPPLNSRQIRRTPSAKMPAASFQAILDKALADYCEQIGVELDKHPFIDELRGRDSPDNVLKLLEEKANTFKVYRDGNRKLISGLNRVVRVIQTLSGVIGQAVSTSVSLMGRISLVFSPPDISIVRLPGAIPTGASDLRWRGRSNHGVYP